MAKAFKPIGPAPQIRTGWPKTRPERWIPPKATEMGSTRAAVEKDMVSGILRARRERAYGVEGSKTDVAYVSLSEKVRPECDGLVKTHLKRKDAL
jgi:hypothetical protein